MTPDCDHMLGCKADTRGLLRSVHKRFSARIKTSEGSLAFPKARIAWMLLRIQLEKRW